MECDTKVERRLAGGAALSVKPRQDLRKLFSGCQRIGAQGISVPHRQGEGRQEAVTCLSLPSSNPPCTLIVQEKNIPYDRNLC
jgi:hypothetical protein